MSDIIQMQMNRDNFTVNTHVSQSIDDILSKNKNINNDKNNLNDKFKNKNQEIIENNEVMNKDNKSGEKNFPNQKIKRTYKNIFPIIIQAFLGTIVFLDFINFLFSPNVRLYLLYNFN